jgi:hypothetical protein
MDIPANIDDPGPTPRFLKNTFPKSGNMLAMTDLNRRSAIVEIGGQYKPHRNRLFPARMDP